MTLSEVVARLSGAKSSGTNQFLARCPVHEDRTQSLSVGMGADSRVLLHCHAGCSTDSILSALGLAVGDLFPDQAGVPVQAPVRPVIRAVSSPTYYDYTDATGTVLHQVVRGGADKSFRQRHRNGTGEWVWKSSGIRVPYRLHDLMASQSKTVWVCEGEKDVDACWNLGLSATTNLGGSGKWGQSETDALVKAGPWTQAYVIPDNDIPGRTHAESVIASLTKAKMTATLVTLEGLKPHGDLSDWLSDPTHDRAALENRAHASVTSADPRSVLVTPMAGRLEVDAVPPDLLTASSEFVRLSEGRYTLTYPDLGIVFDASRLRLERQRDLHGQLTVRTTMQGAKTVDGVLSSSSLNFSSQQSRSRMANFLALRSGSGAALDWLGALEVLCWKVTGAEEEGTPVQALSDVALPVPEPTWDIAGIHLVPHEPCIMFGDGGTGKSYLALWIATQLCNRGEKVLYCDFEFSASEHRLRLQRLCGPDPLPGARLQYVRCVNPLVTEQSRLEAAIHDHQITFAIYDSIVFGLNGPPESAEIAAAYFRATRSLGVGSLHLAHTTKQASQDGQQAEKPFGSAYFHNGARATYLVQRAPAGPNQALVELSITHKKSNVGPLLPPVGVRLTFTENRTEIDPFDLAQSPDLSASLPIWQRVKSLVATGPGLTVKELAEELSVPPGSVAKAVSRMDMFRKDHQQRVRLVNSNEIIL